MKLKNIIILQASMFVCFAVCSCTKDLNREPIIGLNGSNVYNTLDDYRKGIAGVYDKQLTNDYLYNFWFLEEVPTDEIAYTWDDGYTFQIKYMTWGSNNTYVDNLYLSIYDIVSTANEYLRQSTDDQLHSKGFNENDIDSIHIYRAEARYVRALAYYYGLSEYGNIPFVTEKDPVGNFTPPRIERDSLFHFIESELLDIQGDLLPSKSSYGRADESADWSLLARLYINANIFTGNARYNDCITFCNKIISTGKYSLSPNYKNVFLADNDQSAEIIFPFPYSYKYTQSYGTLNSIIHSEITAAANPEDYGVIGAWLSLRTNQNLVNIFNIAGNTIDPRGIFQTAGQTLEVKTENDYTQGYGVGKFKNVTSKGVMESDPTGTFVDTDFPVFRLADIYLMYAESVLRGGSGGSSQTAAEYINLLRQRAYNNDDHNISIADLTLDFIFNERQREMYWEATRRSDLIRFGKFTEGIYLWPFKGGVQGGKAVEDFRNIYPIPSSDLTVNPNLVQNPGY